jgi:hypothetical protein
MLVVAMGITSCSLADAANYIKRDWDVKHLAWQT